MQNFHNRAPSPRAQETEQGWSGEKLLADTQPRHPPHTHPRDPSPSLWVDQLPKSTGKECTRTPHHLVLRA